jgi:battenin
MYRARFAAVFKGADPRVCVAFWLFGGPPSPILYNREVRLISIGLINNVLYVIILSAALDLVGPSVPKGVVLLCDVIPSFLTKLCAPYFIHAIPYPIRIILMSMLSAVGMLLIALTPAYTGGGTISTKMAGVVLASLSSGAGELSFLALTHHYGPFSLAAWGGGIGGAGLIGAGTYFLTTAAIGLSSKNTIFRSAFLPLIMLASFYIILSRAPPARRPPQEHSRTRSTDEDEDSVHRDTGVTEEERLL